MKLRIVVIVVFALASLAPDRAGAASDIELQSTVDRVAGGFRGSLGIYAKDLKGGESFAYHADELFATASVFKVPVMIELFRRAERGEIRLDQRRRLPRTGISRQGTGVVKYLRDEPELSLLDYCRLMIGYSDNMATDVLMQVVDARAITATMERMGFPHTRVAANCTTMHYRMAGIDSTSGSGELDALVAERAQARKMVPGAGFADRSPNGNVTTPREMGTIFERLELGRVVSVSASARMIEILKQNTNRAMVPKDLPADTAVAHKTGASSVVRADAGIVYLAHGPVVVSIFTYAEPGETGATESIARIAAAVVRWSQSLASR